MISIPTAMKLAWTLGCASCGLSSHHLTLCLRASLRSVHTVYKPKLPEHWHAKLCSGTQFLQAHTRMAVVAFMFMHAALQRQGCRKQKPRMQWILQPPPEDTGTELDPKYKVTYLSSSEAAAQPLHQDMQEEAIAASYAFSQLEASLSGIPISPNTAEAISRLGMTASTSGTTAASEQGKTRLTLHMSGTDNICTALVSRSSSLHTSALSIERAGGDRAAGTASPLAVGAFLSRQPRSTSCMTHVDHTQHTLANKVSPC